MNARGSALTECMAALTLGVGTAGTVFSSLMTAARLQGELEAQHRLNAIASSVDEIQALAPELPANRVLGAIQFHFEPHANPQASCKVGVNGAALECTIAAGKRVFQRKIRLLAPEGP